MFDAKGPSILDQPLRETIALHDACGSPTAEARQRIGQRLGAWMIDGVLGSGGMGTVYRASRDDGAYKREVALKCIRGDLMSSVALAAFHKERNALAALNHRDIVPILDGGVADDGTPWLVMPLIDGVPIDRWCDERRLSVASRVRLMVSVCDALAHAHKCGVLHQDIKASAVLVTADAQPKLLDFGLAEIAHGSHATPLDDDRYRACSPGSAAPEQLQGGRPSVAIDIYALGVLLYRLLCAREPSTLSLPHVPLIALIGRDSELPSKLALAASPAECGSRHCKHVRGLQRLLKGDLDLVASMCVAVNPEARYTSVDLMREDLQRWLDRRPISLRGGASYVARRFLQRNALHVTVAALLAVATTAGIVALRQQAETVREVELSSRVNQIFSQSLGAATLSRTGDLPLNSTQLLDRIEANLRQYAARDPAYVLARGLSILARSQTDAGNYEKAQALALESRGSDDGASLQFAFNQVTVARLYNLHAQHVLAERAAREGLDKLRFVLGRQERLAALQLRIQLAGARSGQGERSEALDLLNTAIREASELGSASGDLVLAQMLTLRGIWYRQQLRLDASARDLSRASELAQGIEPRIVDDARESLIRTMRLSSKPGKEARALKLAEELLESRRKTLGEGHPQTAMALGELAFAQIMNQDNQAANASVRQAEAIITGTLGVQHPAYARLLIARSHLLIFERNLKDAMARTVQALAILERHYGQRHELVLDARFLLANEYWQLSHDDPEAMRKAIGTMGATIDSYVSQYGEVAALHRIGYSAMLSANGQPKEAAQQLVQARKDAPRQYGPSSQEMLHIRLSECTFMASQGDSEHRLVRELGSLIADAGRVDSLYARSILFSAYLGKAKWQLQSSDVPSARGALDRARGKSPCGSAFPHG